VLANHAAAGVDLIEPNGVKGAGVQLQAP